MGALPEKVETYKARIGDDILKRWNGCVRVWDTPQSAVDGAEVIDTITQPTRRK